MKKYILSSLTITFLLLSITACSQGKQISGSSNYITKNIKVGSFDQIKSMSSSDIVYTQKQGAPTVQIYGPDNIVELMETSVSGRTLTIKFKKNTSIRNSGKLEIRVSSPSLKHLSIYGSGNTTFTNGIKSHDELQMSIYGSGNVLLDGKSTEAEYHIAGSGDINATELKVENVNARISGSGSIRCYATENLTGGVSGSGNVAYKGNPQINFSKRGLQKL